MARLGFDLKLEAQLEALTEGVERSILHRNPGGSKNTSYELVTGQ